jgi:hypothetical protein
MSPAIERRDATPLPDLTRYKLLEIERPEMLDALVVFVERHHIGDGFFMILIAAHDKLKFDTHTGASPGLSDR